MAKKYRVDFRLPDGRRGVCYCQTKAEANLTRSMVGALIATAKSGIVNQDALQWASRISDAYYAKLVRWGLLTERSVGTSLQKLVEHVIQNHDISDSIKNQDKLVGDKLFKFFSKNRDISTITRAEAERFVNYLFALKTQIRGTDVTKNSVATWVSRTKFMFNEAVRLDWIQINPFAMCHASMEVKQDKWVYVTKEEVLRVVENVTSKELRAMIILSRFAGCRGESEFEMFKWNPKYIRWSTSDSTASLSIEAPKLVHHVTRKWRTVPLPDFAERYISDWFDCVPEGVENMFGVTRAIRTLNVKIVDVFRDNGIELFRPYNLRRSFCSDMMSAVGADPKMYESLCGHTFKIGMQHYQMLHQNRRTEGENKVLEFWRSTGCTTSFTTPLDASPDRNTHKQDCHATLENATK